MLLVQESNICSQSNLHRRALFSIMAYFNSQLKHDNSKPKWFRSALWHCWQRNLHWRSAAIRNGEVKEAKRHQSHTILHVVTNILLLCRVCSSRYLLWHMTCSSRGYPSSVDFLPPSPSVGILLEFKHVEAALIKPSSVASWPCVWAWLHVTLIAELKHVITALGEIQESPSNNTVRAH